MDWNRLWHKKKNTTKERHSSDYWDSFAPTITASTPAKAPMKLIF